MKKRSFIAILLLICFIIMPLSALLIHLNHGKFIEHLFLHIHAYIGIIFVILGIIHIILNWKVLKKYLSGKK